MPFPPLKFEGSVLRLLDQRKLPHKEAWITCRTSSRVHWAIRSMVVRGAPAIGVAGGYGHHLGVVRFNAQDRRRFFKKLHEEAEFLKSARPTGVNLRNVIDSMVSSLTALTEHLEEADIGDLKRKVYELARAAHEEDDRLCRMMGGHGAKLLRDGERVLTHCNAGGLATSGFGTALGVLYAAQNEGKKISVFADETRPLLQGARLTAWELSKSGIPCTLLCDNSAASLMRAGKITCVIVGADRIAANGDTANKIGTYNVAVLARAHRVPFYVAAPGTTFDFKIKTGDQIPIENRDKKEVLEGLGKKIAPDGIHVLNPAFDVTPYRFITAFITEAGVLRPPFKHSFKKLRPSVLPHAPRIFTDRKT